jgi:hypothetical protein
MIQHNQTSNSKFNGLVQDINSMEYYLDIKPKGQYIAQTNRHHIFKNQPSWETQRNKTIKFTTNWKFNYLLRHVHHRFLNIIKINEKDYI